MVVMSGEFIFGYIGPIQSLLYMTLRANFINFLKSSILYRRSVHDIKYTHYIITLI
jgi:hypothetical protein